MLPSIFGRDLFDDFGGFPFDGFERYRASDLMKTDVKEADAGYELTIDMPGIKKEDVKAELKDGYLTISATSNYGSDDSDKDGKYIRRERHYGSCSRSYYVGDSIKQEDIKAKFENGTLRLVVPKPENKQLPENRNYIQID